MLTGLHGMENKEWAERAKEQLRLRTEAEKLGYILWEREKVVRGVTYLTTLRSARWITPAGEVVRGVKTAIIKAKELLK